MRTRAASPRPPTRIEPTLLSAIRAVRRRISARMMISPTSAEPTISARKCAPSNASAVQPSGPALASVNAARPLSWVTSPVNWPGACVVTMPSRPAPSRLTITTLPRSTR